MTALHFTFGNMILHQATTSTFLPIVTFIALSSLIIIRNFSTIIETVYNIFATRYTVIYTTELSNGEVGTTTTTLTQRDINGLINNVNIVSITRA